MQQVILVDHDPHWAREFAQEVATVTTVLGNGLVTVHHIGSTAIPGICAKPIIDMLGVVHDLDWLDEQTSRMQELGYEALGEYGIPGRRYFRKDNATGIRTHHLHVFQVGSAQIERHLAFRDFMRAHPHHASQYEALKVRLAKLHAADIFRYSEGKDAFIKEMDTQAAAWRAGEMQV